MQAIECFGPQQALKSNAAILRREIIKRSVATNWADARAEWFVADIYMADFDDYRTCLCTKEHIKEICVLHNSFNQNEVEVGNVCVKKFMNENAQKLFDGIERIKSDINCGLSEAVAALFRRRRIITEWEFKFSIDTWRKRYLSGKQAATRVEINRKVLANMKRNQ